MYVHGLVVYIENILVLSLFGEESIVLVEMSNVKMLNIDINVKCQMLIFNVGLETS